MRLGERCDIRSDWPTGSIKEREKWKKEEKKTIKKTTKTNRYIGKHRKNN